MRPAPDITFDGRVGSSYQVHGISDLMVSCPHGKGSGGKTPPNIASIVLPNDEGLAVGSVVVVPVPVGPEGEPVNDAVSALVIQPVHSHVPEVVPFGVAAVADVPSNISLG